MEVNNRPFLIWLIWLGLIEGTSTLVLFLVAMPLKYGYDMPMAVSVVGPIHGVLFLGLIAMFWIGRSEVPLSTKLMWWGMVGAVVPLMPFFIDVKLYELLKQDSESGT